MTTANPLHSKHGATFELDALCEEAFCKFIAQRTGIVLQDHQLSNLRDTVRKGCAHFSFIDCAKYLHTLQQTLDVTAPLEYLIAGVTIGESYFFRDSEQIDMLKNNLFPEMIAAKRQAGNLVLRVWSAGCSQGQEIYTIAMMLHELLPDIAQWRIHLLGTDINSEVVAKAMQGRYNEWSFRATPVELRERWFMPVGREFEIVPQIRRMVHFAYLNLTTDAYPSIHSETNALDLILCRNVFIYLDRQAVQRSMTQYAQCLLEQGMLILGASDPLEYKHTELEWVPTKSASYLRKAAARDRANPEIRLAPRTSPVHKARVSDGPSAGAVSKPTVLPKAPLTPSSSRQSTLEKRITPVTTGRPGQLPEEMIEVIKLLSRSDWTAVLTHVEASCQQGKESSELWQMKAKALANLGRAEEALQACVRSLQLDPENKHAYLMQGLILAELNRGQDAEDALRKALYLDRSFLEAHYELGMLKVRAQNAPAGIKSLEVAMKLALGGDPERELHNAAGMTYRRFAQVLQQEIDMLGGAGKGATGITKSR